MKYPFREFADFAVITDKYGILKKRLSGFCLFLPPLLQYIYKQGYEITNLICASFNSSCRSGIFPRVSFSLVFSFGQTKERTIYVIEVTLDSRLRGNDKLI